jgi:hypothetical protein
MSDTNFLGDLLADPEIMSQVEPLLSAAIDAKIAPLAEQLAKLTQGVTLMAQAQVEMAAGSQPIAQPPEQPMGQPMGQPIAQPLGQPMGQPMAQQPPPQAAQMQPQAPAGIDKLASLAPLLMQYLTGQQNSQGNLGQIAETLSAAAQIGNVMNAPLYQGMRMATDMMSMAGRSGIEPTVAADTLGGMIENVSANNVTGDPKV